MDYDACITDIAGNIEATGKKNGQRWIVDRGALRTILEHYAPTVADTPRQPKAGKGKAKDDKPDDS
jgi:hypothetical protein